MVYLKHARYNANGKKWPALVYAGCVIAGVVLGAKVSAFLYR